MEFVVPRWDEKSARTKRTRPIALSLKTKVLPVLTKSKRILNDDRELSKIFPPLKKTKEEELFAEAFYSNCQYLNIVGGINNESHATGMKFMNAICKEAESIIEFEHINEEGDDIKYQEGKLNTRTRGRYDTDMPRRRQDQGNFFNSEKKRKEGTKKTGFFGKLKNALSRSEEMNEDMMDDFEIEDSNFQSSFPKEKNNSFFDSRIEKDEPTIANSKNKKREPSIPSNKEKNISIPLENFTESEGLKKEQVLIQLMKVGEMIKNDQLNERQLDNILEILNNYLPPK